MGRGLSELQEKILVLCLRQREDPMIDHRFPDAMYAEVLADTYGFKPEKRDLRMGGHRFSRQTIGEKKYDAAEAAVCRAMRRLSARGLVECWQGLARWAGATLTDIGLQVAREVTVKTRGSSPNHNR